ncbi:MAG: hypothetical protein R2941_06830 [Desulfobacterales bacterium]
MHHEQNSGESFLWRSATDLFNHWKIGQEKKKQRCAACGFVPGQKLQVEVEHGLEETGLQMICAVLSFPMILFLESKTGIIIQTSEMDYTALL